MEDRFWKMVEKREPDGCWEWQGNVLSDGYGSIRMPGAQGQPVKAHRYSWELHHGPIPEGVLVLHRCDNQRCVRPDHLFLGSQSDNMQDMHNKRRHSTSPKRRK